VIIHDEYDTVRFVNSLKTLDYSKPHEITIKIYDPEKTNPQLSLYWKWIDEGCEQSGAFKHGLDKDLREALTTPQIYKKVNGQDSEYYKSVGKMGKKEMSAYMDKVWITLSDFGVVLTNPDELQRRE
jgi:hypothetical protein